MKNYKNYYVYADAIKNEQNFSVYVPSINLNNINDHINGIYAMLKDGIETDYVQNLLVNISWGGDIECDLYVIDYWYSLWMWKMLLVNGDKIEPKHIFYDKELKRKNIKKFVDEFILTTENKIRLGNEFLNNNICDGLWAFSYIESFSYYLANTINNEDDIALMLANPEYEKLFKTSLEGVPFEDVKDEGMKVTNKAIDIIKNSREYLGYDHGLTASFQAGEAVNPRQFKEARFNIGTKPNGSGGIYPHIIDKSFTNGGVNDPISFFIESSSARTAQILSKNNVGDSGDFARILGLNNTDTVLFPYPDYGCMTKNLIKFEIKTDKHLSMMKNRYYRFNPNGMEYVINPKDKSLIGKTIYLRSPMTCACNSDGKGICRKCYGDLYFTNNNINIGKIGAEILSSQLTQRLLSAKHLLETKIISMKWNQEFYEIFSVNINTIVLDEGIEDILDLKHTYLVINPDDVVLESDSDDETILYDIDDDDDIASDFTRDDDNVVIYNEYITSFTIKYPDGSCVQFGTKDRDSIYISQELNKIIRKKATNEDGVVNIALSDLVDNPVFFIKILNNEISKTMDDIINIINKNDVARSLNKDTALQSIVDKVVEGDLTIDAVHLEVILSNQLINPNNVLRKPRWDYPNVDYKFVSLNTALNNNPSIIVSLLYKDLGSVLYNPLSYRKNKPSFFDLFFHEQPQNYIKSDCTSSTESDQAKGIELCRYIDNNEE